MQDKFTKDQNELADRLMRTGMRKLTAVPLVYIAGNEGCKQKDIQEGAGLRQPEVSIGVSELKGRGWLAKKDVKKDEGKGRPSHEYHLEKSIEEVISDIEEREEERVSKIRENVEKMKDLAEKVF